MLSNLLIDTYNGDLSVLRLLLQEHYENAILLNVRGEGIYGDPYSRKSKRLVMTEPYDMLSNPVYHSGIGKHILETMLATRLYPSLEGVEPWPRSDDKGKYDSRSQVLTHTPTLFRSAGWQDSISMAMARVSWEVLFWTHFESRPFHPPWD